MRFNALMDTRTRRVESVVLSSDTFGDEKLLTAIIEAFEHPSADVRIVVHRDELVTVWRKAVSNG